MAAKAEYASSAQKALKAQRRRFTVLLLSGLLTLGLPHLPVFSYLVYPLVLLSTFAHELGHGLAGLVVGVGFEKMFVFSDGSGLAFTGGGGRLQRAAVSAGGLIGPALTAMVLFLMGRKRKTAFWGLAFVTGVFGLALLLYVRNLFGAGFVLALVLVLGSLLRWANDTVIRFTLVFLAVNLSVSVFTRGDYLFTDVAHLASGDRPSDVASMASALFLPYWFWGAACGAISVLALILGLRFYLHEGDLDDASPSGPT